VSIPQRKGDPLLVETDEGVRPGTTMESLGGLKPAFDKEGTITAANASQISDGGSAIVMMSERGGERPRREPARPGRRLRHGGRPRQRVAPHQPSRAILKALGKAGLTVADVDLFELNEAFAAVGIASMAELGITDEIVNVNGGAIALGHPIGMSGNRLALTILHELKRRGGGTRRRGAVRRWRPGRRHHRAHRLIDIPSTLASRRPGSAWTSGPTCRSPEPPVTRSTAFSWSDERTGRATKTVQRHPVGMVDTASASVT
jgi:acetyl-CoA acetyltransferase